VSIEVVWQHGYGKVDSHDGQHAETRFAQLFLVPLWPTSSQWVVGKRLGIPIRLHGRSVAATYLRFWAPIVALLTFAIGSGVASLVVAGALLAASAWSWTWRKLPRSAHRRSDFNQLAFGVRCDPQLMTAAHRERCAEALKQRWDAKPDSRPPDDIARLGARDLEEAVVAYGILRLAAIDHGVSPELAARLLDGARDDADRDGPYRELAAGEAQPQLADQVAEVAQQVSSALPQRRLR